MLDETAAPIGVKEALPVEESVPAEESLESRYHVPPFAADLSAAFLNIYSYDFTYGKVTLMLAALEGHVRLS